MSDRHFQCCISHVFGRPGSGIIFRDEWLPETRTRGGSTPGYVLFHSVLTRRSPFPHFDLLGRIKLGRTLPEVPGLQGVSLPVVDRLNSLPEVRVLATWRTFRTHGGVRRQLHLPPCYRRNLKAWPVPPQNYSREIRTYLTQLSTMLSLELSGRAVHLLMGSGTTWL